MEDLVNLVTLADGSQIILQNEDDISLSLISNDGTKDIFQFPYHSGSYGGGSLLLSPSERYVIFSYFSGESEEGFVLLEIVNNQFKFCMILIICMEKMPTTVLQITKKF